MKKTKKGFYGVRFYRGQIAKISRERDCENIECCAGREGRRFSDEAPEKRRIPDSYQTCCTRSGRSKTLAQVKLNKIHLTTHGENQNACSIELKKKNMKNRNINMSDAEYPVRRKAIAIIEAVIEPWLKKGIRGEKYYALEDALVEELLKSNK